MIEIVPGRYYAAMWMAPLAPPAGAATGGDWLACLWRLEHERTRWTVDARFRYAVDPRLWGSADVRRWTRTRLDGSEAEVRARMEVLARALGALAGCPVERWDIRGDSARYAALAAHHPPPWLAGDPDLPLAGAA